MEEATGLTMKGGSSELHIPWTGTSSNGYYYVVYPARAETMTISTVTMEGRAIVVGIMAALLPEPVEPAARHTVSTGIRHLCHGCPPQKLVGTLTWLSGVKLGVLVRSVSQSWRGSGPLFVLSWSCYPLWSGWRNVCFLAATGYDTETGRGQKQVEVPPMATADHHRVWGMMMMWRPVKSGGLMGEEPAGSGGVRRGGVGVGIPAM